MRHLGISLLEAATGPQHATIRDWPKSLGHRLPTSMLQRTSKMYIDRSPKLIIMFCFEIWLLGILPILYVYISGCILPSSQQ